MEIKIKIDAPELAGAINNLAQALQGFEMPQPTEIKIDGKTVAESVEKATPDKAPEKTAAEEPKEEKASTGLTFEQVRVKLAEVSQKGKQKELKELITSMGAARLSDIPEEKYSELLEKASEL